MVYNFQDRMNTLGTRFKAINFELVDIIRGNEVCEEVKASPILQMADEIVPGVSVSRVEYSDWCIDVADYPDKPQVGDIIKDRCTGAEYRVTAQSNDEPPYRYTTHDRVRYIVHTLLQKAADK